MTGTKRILGASFLLAVGTLFAAVDVWHDGFENPQDTYPSLSAPDARKLLHHQQRAELPAAIIFDGALMAAGVLLAKSGMKAALEP